MAFIRNWQCGDYTFLKEKPSSAALVTEHALQTHVNPAKGGNLTSDCQVVKYVQNIYATDDIVAEPEANITT